MSGIWRGTLLGLALWLGIVWLVAWLVREGRAL